MSKSVLDAGGTQPPRMEARAAAATKQGGRRPRVKPTDALLGALRSPETVNRGKDTKETDATIWSGDWSLRKASQKGDANFSQPEAKLFS